MQENQRKFSTVEVKVFVALFGVFLLVLSAADSKSLLPLCFLPAVLLLMWIIGDEETDKINDPENWDDDWM